MSSYLKFSPKPSKLGYFWVNPIQDKDLILLTFLDI